MNDPDAPSDPKRSAVEIRLQLGSAAAISVETIDSGVEALPVITIEHDGLAVMIEPFGPGEGGRVSPDDVQRAVELAMAAQGYLTSLLARFKAQLALEQAAGAAADMDTEYADVIAALRAADPLRDWPTPPGRTPEEIRSFRPHGRPRT